MRDDGNQIVVGETAVPQEGCPSDQAWHMPRAEGLLRTLNPDYHAVLQKRLRQNPRALEYLHVEGFNHETVSYFGLGLSAPYLNRKSGREQADALVYPLRLRDGGFGNKYGYYNIPGVTRNPTAQGGWMSGDPHTYYASATGDRKSVFVCHEAKDLWHLWQGLRGSPYAGAILLIASTHGANALPSSWKDPTFWECWDQVYLGYDDGEAGERVCNALRDIVGREARRALVPPEFGGGWPIFWRSGRGVEVFEKILEGAEVLSLEVRSDEEVRPAYGRFSYEPISIDGAFHNGHLYYTVQVLNRELDTKREGAGLEVVVDVERLETVVVRSDRTVHSARRVPAPKGTRDKDRVMRLTDGTLLDREPQANKYGTWSWPSIRAYIEGKSRVRPLAEILRDVTMHLKATVWLPNEEDYALLTLVVPVTYAQRIFDSVPLVFLNGPAGTGKSEMGRAMARVCANAYVCGQSSAASVARFIDESRGFVVLDDLEVIGNRGGEFTELVQALKLSYNKTTAVKLWTDVKTMRTRLLDFYGVKMINNTQGADPILGSRMLHIRTRRLPDRLKDDFARLMPPDGRKLLALRDELHTWTFENVALIEAEYRALCPKGTDRADEITAPLRVMARLAGDDRLSELLDAALARQRRKAINLEDPYEALREAMNGLVARGYRLVSVTHVALEIRDLLTRDLGAGNGDEMPDWVRPECVGRMLRGEGMIDATPERVRRIRVKGSNLRFYPVSADFIEMVKRQFQAEGVEAQRSATEPQSFCQACDSCSYRLLQCEIMGKALARRRVYKSRPAMA